MRVVVAFLFLAIAACACAGDCLSCHPVLKPNIEQDSDHRVMLTCIECHSESTNPYAPCGGNCFACHAPSNIPQSIEQHKPLPGCRDCHIGVNDSSHFIFGLVTPPPESGLIGTLKPILNGK